MRRMFKDLKSLLNKINSNKKSSIQINKFNSNKYVSFDLKIPLNL